MLLGERLARMVRQTVSNLSEECLEFDCLNIRLDSVFWREKSGSDTQDTDLSNLPQVEDIFVEMRAEPGEYYLLNPGEFIKARTIEMFDTRGMAISGMLSLRSKFAQVGLEQSTSVWIKPNRNTGHLILELKNLSEHRALKLWPGLAIAQIHFFEGTT